MLASLPTVRDCSCMSVILQRSDATSLHSGATSFHTRLQELMPRGPDAVVLLDEWVKRAIAVRGGADWGALAQFLVSIVTSLSSSKRLEHTLQRVNSGARHIRPTGMEPVSW